jgi:regulator of sirC expression with transglutaminase-like and TPR domain
MPDSFQQEIQFLQSTIEDLNKEIKKNPVDYEIYNHRAFIYFIMKDYEKALVDVTFSIKLCATCEYSYMLRDMIQKDMNNNN